MECLVYRRGEAVGTLKIEEDGLYRILTARIPLYREILRLYVPQAMGVFVPEEGSLICRRRISRGKLPVKPVFACAWCEKDSLWSAESKGLRRRWLPEGVELALARLNHAINFRMENEKNRLRSETERLRRVSERRLEQERIRLTAAAEKLSALNPLGVLDRGYALIYAPGDRMITSAEAARKKQELSIRFSDGWVDVSRRESPNGRE